MWSGFTYGIEDFRSQDPFDGRTLCSPERRAYNTELDKLEERYRKIK
jgi:hypothetical protein